ncbi:MAG TPA: LuxR C-terminal-related transcriptional regulator [Acidimicrobiales bacterium]|nr:LuxR C-terminal-related transcriptional regulator [Acidimicrobiales bacterium]
MRQGQVPVGTKGCVPRLPPLHVPRPRLERRLAEPGRAPVTLVCAPPGAGKSTLLASALAPSTEQDTGGRPAAWLCLDERDNDAGRLVTLLRAALSARLDHPSRRRPSVPVLDQLDELLGRLAAGDDPAQVLVLDDVHALRSAPAIELVDHLLHNAPPQLEIVLASRADPPVGLDDLRLDGRLAEIRNADLAFDAAETTELLARHEVTLGGDEVQALWARTEGWAAGLRLAACALQTETDPGRFVRSAARTAAVVSDYLLRELLVRKDDAVQWFLLRTSVADRLTPELAQLLSGDDRAADHLVELERSGILVLDHADDRWCRYHALFGALLRARLDRHDADLARELHGQAAQWFLEQDMPSDAQSHAQSARDWDLLGQLLTWRWIDATLDGLPVEGDLLPEGLEPATIAASPGLALVAAADACRRSNRDEAVLYRDALDELVASPSHAPAGEPEPFAVERRVLDVVFGCAFGGGGAGGGVGAGGERALAAAGALRSAELSDPAAVDLRRFASLRGAELAIDAGDIDGARELLADLAQRAERCWVTAEASGLLALLHAAGGRPALVGPLVDKVLDGDCGVTTPQAACAARLASVLMLAQRGEQRSAADTLVGTLADAADGGGLASRTLRTVARVVGIGVNAVPGRPVALDAASVGRSVLAEQALVALGVVEVVTPDGRPLLLGGPAEHAVQEGRLRLAAGDVDQADHGIALWLDGGDRVAHPRTLVEAVAVAAIAAGARDQQDLARRWMAEALDLAEATAVMAPLLLHGSRLGPLLQRNLSELGERMGAALELLDRTRPSGAGELVEPLTDREMEVLVHLPTLMSNAEIASGLYLSVNTVKTHLKAVYRKLGVDGRRQAVVRGRELELI